MWGKWSAPCRYYDKRGGAIAPPLYFKRVNFDPFREE
uniref:Uncharacterized protein n=1 Tax=Siphoviridae sp. ctnhN1 TaxID=2827589 RepID=A0A8S5LKE9_9CAUD|nr:MAG TPA: hypothetical protein [Siphoviridae sp. ctnhN1]